MAVLEKPTYRPAVEHLDAEAVLEDFLRRQTASQAGDGWKRRQRYAETHPLIRGPYQRRSKTGNTTTPPTI